MPASLWFSEIGLWRLAMAGLLAGLRSLRSRTHRLLPSAGGTGRRSIQSVAIAMSLAVLMGGTWASAGVQASSAASPPLAVSSSATASPSGGSSSGPDVPTMAGFSMSNDLSTATITLLHASGLRFVGSTGSLNVDPAGSLEVPVPFASETQPDTVTLTEATDPASVVQIDYWPSAYYASVGVKSEGVILLYTTLARAGSPDRQEQTGLPASGSVSVDSTGWAALRSLDFLPSADAPIDEQIRRLYSMLDLAAQQPNVQVCASGTGVDQLMGIANHACTVWCSGYSVVARDYLRSAGIPARYISLGGPYSFLPDGTLVELSETHDTVEMWLGGAWVWTDPTMRVLAAEGPDGRRLSLGAVIDALNDPATRDRLRFVQLDPATSTWQTLTYAQESTDFRTGLARFLTADKTMVVANHGDG